MLKLEINPIYFRLVIDAEIIWETDFVWSTLNVRPLYSSFLQHLALIALISYLST